MSLATVRRVLQSSKFVDARGNAKPSGYWNKKNNVYEFLAEIRQKYNLNTPEDWNSITYNHIQSNGGRSLLKRYSVFKLKCMACPEGKQIFTNPNQPAGYWENKENVKKFLEKIKTKYNIKSPEDWNSLSTNQIKSNGGNGLLKYYSVYELKAIACPEGTELFDNPYKSSGYWEIDENIRNFLIEIKQKYNLQSPDDWNSITHNQIKSNGGATLLHKHSMFDLKCLACPEGKMIFNNTIKPSGYWKNKENILQFLMEIKKKFNINTPEDWNSITRNQIQSSGGGTLLRKYTMYDLKCMICPEGKSIFEYPNKSKPSKYWDNEENIQNFLSEIQQKYNLNSPKDWNSITSKQIRINGGIELTKKYSMYEIKCMACPEGKEFFDAPYKPAGYWENKGNVLKFLSELSQKYNLKTPEDYNSITYKYIPQTLLKKYSIFELKCMACPEGKSVFDKQPKSSLYWENENNILEFLSTVKQKYNLQSPEDWNSVTRKQIQSIGGNGLFKNYSLFALKCLACPEGKDVFDNQPKSSEFWQDESNRDQFFEKLRHKYNLKNPNDWKRLSKSQIISQGGNWLFKRNKNLSNIQIKFESSDNKNIPEYLPLNELISETLGKRSSQRYLFLQVQKLFPREEIVEDYFHSEISRISGCNVQFDIFMIQRNIAIEYHGRHHYEDIPQAFSNLETYKNRDIEKEKLCKKHGIQLIVIPYWWDNNLDSLKETLKLKMAM